MASFSPNEKVYFKKCEENDRFKWKFENGQIKNMVAVATDPHCLTVGTHNSRKKQAITLQKCDLSNKGQKWVYEDGMLKVDEYRGVCIESLECRNTPSLTGF